jgi:ribosomal protein L40E
MTANDAKDTFQSEITENEDVCSSYNELMVAHMLKLKDRKQTCLCCGHVNPNAALDCEKCYVRL